MPPGRPVYTWVNTMKSATPNTISGVTIGTSIGLAGLLIAVVAIESLVLVVNAWRCPLTAVAAQYTNDRAPNFDIYLPRWLAQYNKEIFGPLYVVGVLFTLYRWRTG